MSIPIDECLNIFGATCPKCTSPNVTQNFKETNDGEYLSRRCHTCHYVWMEPCADAHSASQGTKQ